MTEKIAEILENNENAVLDAWLALQPDVDELRTDLVSQNERRDLSLTFLRAVGRALEEGTADIHRQAWDDVRALLQETSRAWVQKGVRPSETALFVLSVKQPLFDQLVRMMNSSSELVRSTWETSLLIDKLGMYVLDFHLQVREEIIARQREEVLELSTPVVEVWSGILVLPIIGVLDSQRSQQIMQALLTKIVDSQAEHAIVDITGVPAVDSLTAQHLVKTATAARFMGARCAISGIRPQIAQTMVGLGIDFGELETHGTLAAALKSALRYQGTDLGMGRLRHA